MQIGAWAAAPQGVAWSQQHQRCSGGVQHPTRPRAAAVVPRVASGHVAADGTPNSAQAVLDRYQGLLREYHLHKQALGDWFSGVLRQQRRPPQLMDAQATGDEALVARFQQYLMVRKRLLAEIPLMREQLNEALEQDTAHHGSSSSKHSKHKQSVNANQATPVTRGQAVGQYFAAVNYRQQQGLRAAKAAAAAAAAAAAEGVSGVESEDMSPEFAQAAAAVAALVSHHASAAAAAAAPAAFTQQQQAAGKAEAAAGHLLSAASSSSSSGSSSAAGGGSRAAAAAMAALAYKQGNKAGSGASSSRQQRPLAIQMAEPPAPPPGYQAPTAAVNGGAVAAAAAGNQQYTEPMVEAGQMDAVYARAPRRVLDSELSLEATLQGVPGGLGGEQLFAATKVLSVDTPAAAVGAVAAAVVQKGEESASHMLSAAMNSSSSGKASAASSRASSAALAALAYKQRKQTDSSGSSSSRQQRPLAIQMAAAPEPPPGYDASSAAADIPKVEAGRMDVVYARAPRRALDSDLSLEATLQGVPGGLGGEQLFAATTVLEGDVSVGADAAAAPAGAAAISGSSSGSSVVAGQQEQQQQPAAQVVTAKFDVYSGRRRQLDGSQLDELLAGLSEAYSATPAAAAAAAAAAPAAVSADSAGAALPVQSGGAPDKQQQQSGSAEKAQRSSKRAGFGGGDGSSGGPILPPDILPVPT